MRFLCTITTRVRLRWKKRRNENGRRKNAVSNGDEPQSKTKKRGIPGKRWFGNDMKDLNALGRQNKRDLKKNRIRTHTIQLE